MRDKAVVAGIAHRRVEKPIDDQSPGRFVHLVFDGLAADGNLDDDIHIIRGVVSDLDGIDPHNPVSLIGDHIIIMSVCGP